MEELIFIIYVYNPSFKLKDTKQTDIIDPPKLIVEYNDLLEYIRSLIHISYFKSAESDPAIPPPEVRLWNLITILLWRK